MTASGQAEGVAAPRILLVDDEPRICDFISRALETAGYMVDAAGSGTGASAASALPGRNRHGATRSRASSIGASGNGIRPPAGCRMLGGWIVAVALAMAWLGALRCGFGSRLFLPALVAVACVLLDRILPARFGAATAVRVCRTGTTQSREQGGCAYFQHLSLLIAAGRAASAAERGNCDI